MGEGVSASHIREYDVMQRIYWMAVDYLLREGLIEAARSLAKEADVEVVMHHR